MNSDTVGTVGTRRSI